MLLLTFILVRHSADELDGSSTSEDSPTNTDGDSLGVMLAALAGGVMLILLLGGKLVAGLHCVAGVEMPS